MISVTARTAKPDDVLVTVECTMTVGEWKRLVAQLDSTAYPSWPYAAAVRESINAYTGAQSAPVQWDGR
jgi:hypothetical protein